MPNGRRHATRGAISAPASAGRTISVSVDNAEAVHYSWETVPLETLSDTISRKIISGDKSMAAHVFIKKGGIVPLHSHYNEQITYILEGALEFTINGTKIMVGQGEVLVIPSNVPHEAIALEDTLDLDLFSPPREDWLNGTDAYLRK